MRKTLLKLAPMLKLTRVTTAFGAIANLWFVILWTRSIPQEPGNELLIDVPLWGLLGGGLLAGIGLYAFATSLNDLLDVHRDRALGRPGSPIVDGSASIELAVCMVAASLMLSILGATVFGTGAIIITILLSGAILVYNALGKYIPGIGMLLLSMIYAGHMLIPDLSIRFLLPIWLVMTHSMIVAGLSGYLGRKSPPLSKRAILFAIAGWLASSLVLLTLAITRSQDQSFWPSYVPIYSIIYPIIFIVLFILLIIRRHRKLGAGAALGEKISRYGAIWPALYACGWFAGAGLWTSLAIMSSLTIVGFLVMTILRELYTLIEHPVGYRL